ncbi:conjugal transfer protein TrbI [Mesorhizobium erdmanii]|uniref:Conjugal transfer protein TrbI n=2 Tax=Mesorhizobium TaxID=68287 RepID=A0A3M9X4V1_9HYPH|nr:MULTISPECIES: type IV secretion system protein VirB10 [Mesorhizobium]RNJ42478.1 conjugal transfer protein TrbI [Mesorhizobium japonicum]RXT37496.1 conjugal transfer protein TrbI [Mesorhizobium erdmanii]
MQRSPELEAMARADEPAVADYSVRRKQLLSGGILVLAGVAAAYFVFAGDRPQRGDRLAGDEEFSTTSFRPPTFVRDGPAQPKPAQPEVLQIPPPPPPPPPAKAEEHADTSEFNVPPPPAAAKQADPESPPAADEFPKRYRSNMVVFDNKGSSSTEQLGSPSDGQGVVVTGEDRNSKFLAAAISRGDRTAQAGRIARIDALVPEGTLIAGILETAIVSDLPGQISAVVSQDVYSFDGRRVLIPTGARLIGEYQSDIVRGQKRVFVIWRRMLRDDGVSVRLDSIGADSLGRSGLTGHVDNKYKERFGAAILLSIIGGGASYLAGGGSHSATAGGDDGERAQDLARTTLAQTFSDMANQALGDSLKIPPTISVPQGERIFVFVRQDLDFSALYDDPRAEALKEIRHERGLD